MSAPGGHLLRGPGSRVTGQVRGAGDARPAAPGGTRSTHSSLHLPPTPPGHPRPAAPPGIRLGSGLGASPPLVQPPRVRQGARTAAGGVGDALRPTGLEKPRVSRLGNQTLPGMAPGHQESTKSTGCCPELCPKQHRAAEQERKETPGTFGGWMIRILAL